MAVVGGLLSGEYTRNGALEPITRPSQEIGRVTYSTNTRFLFMEGLLDRMYVCTALDSSTTAALQARRLGSVLRALARYRSHGDSLSYSITTPRHASLEGEWAGLTQPPRGGFKTPPPSPPNNRFCSITLISSSPHPSSRLCISQRGQHVGTPPVKHARTWRNAQ